MRHLAGTHSYSSDEAVMIYNSSKPIRLTSWPSSKDFVDSMQSIDRSKATISKKGFQFKPFRPKTTDGTPLKEANLPDDFDLITFERNGEQRALIMREMAYHHVCQGELAGEPYLITF